MPRNILTGHFQMKSFESIAQEAYEAFFAELHASKRRVMPWAELSPGTRNAWIVAARKMADLIHQVH